MGGRVGWAVVYNSLLYAGPVNTFSGGECLRNTFRHVPERINAIMVLYRRHG